MTTYSTWTNVGATGTAPSITLPPGIPASSIAYVTLEASSSDAVLSGFSGWSVIDGPRQAGASVAMGWLLSKPVGPTDSGTTHTGTLTTAGNPRWGASCVVVTGGTQSTLTYAADGTADATLSIPAFTPSVAGADVLVLAGISVVSGQGHLSVAQPTGWNELLDSGSSYGNNIEINTWAAQKTLTGGPTAQAATTATMDKTARANVWVLTFAPVASSTTPIPVGGSVVATPTTTTATTIAYPAGIQAGDIGILIGNYNGASFTPNTPTGFTAQGSAHQNQNSSTMYQQAYKRVMTGTETGTLALSWPVAAKTSWTLTVWRGAQLAGIAYNDAATDSTVTLAAPAVATPNGPAVFATSWFERSSTQDTSVTPPTGTTLVDAQFGTGSGASSAALARNTTATNTGTVGSGVWTRSPGNLSPSTAVTVAFYGSASAAPATDVWFLVQADGSLKPQTVSYA